MSTFLNQLNLTSLPAQLPALLETARQQQLSYEAFLELALQSERAERQARAQEHRLRSARLPFAARLDSFDWSFQPSVSERMLRELAGLSFVKWLRSSGYTAPTCRMPVSGWTVRRGLPGSERRRPRVFPIRSLTGSAAASSAG